MTTTVTKKEPLVLEITEFLDNGILREKSFREKLSEIDWSRYQDKKVIIRGCDNVPIPIWAYMAVVAQLSQYASRIFWGEPCSAVPIFTRLNR